MKLSDLKNSGHAPSLFSAFLHFDISFMVWVILGAIAPFITTDALLTGANLKVTPSALIQKATPYTLVIKGPQTVKQNPKLKADQPKTVYNLLLKSGHADNDSAKRQTGRKVRRQQCRSRHHCGRECSNPNLFRSPLANRRRMATRYDNVIGLQPMAALQKAGKAFQPVANGYPPSTALKLLAIPLLAAGFWRILLGVLSDRFGSKRVGSRLHGASRSCRSWSAGSSRTLTTGWSLSASSWALPGASFAVACRWPRAGIRRICRGWRWGSPGRATRGRCWRRFLRRCWRKPSAGTPF